LLTQKVGSFYFIAELVIDLDLDYDYAATDHCGSCTACLDACPTQAIVSPYVVDGSKCISYFTIELKENIPQEMKGKFEDWAFGCDICQDVCPWNKFSKAHDEPLFYPRSNVLSMTRKDWDEVTEETFRVVFKDSPLERTKFRGLKRNINFLK
jgi:epoxyqueuosine reductase